MAGKLCGGSTSQLGGLSRLPGAVEVVDAVHDDTCAVAGAVLSTTGAAGVAAAKGEGFGFLCSRRESDGCSCTTGTHDWLESQDGVRQKRALCGYLWSRVGVSFRLDAEVRAWCRVCENAYDAYSPGLLHKPGKRYSFGCVCALRHVRGCVRGFVRRRLKHARISDFNGRGGWRGQLASACARTEEHG